MFIKLLTFLTAASLKTHQSDPNFDLLYASVLANNALLLEALPASPAKISLRKLSSRIKDIAVSNTANKGRYAILEDKKRVQI